MITANRILVVDDDNSLRRVMKMQLEEAGYRVDLASDGQQACRAPCDGAPKSD
jgi:CheY-like chemotaxis protein